MAKIPTFPAFQIIAGFKGKLDFYTWKGIRIVRKWPVITGHHSTPRESSNQARFRYFQKSLKSISRDTKELYWGSARLANWRWHEVAYRWFMGLGPNNLQDTFPGQYPRLKPWHDPLRRFWFIHKSYLETTGDRIGLYTWVDRPGIRLTLIATTQGIPFVEHFRVERGVTKSCGFKPAPWKPEVSIAMDSGAYAEFPVVTHFVNDMLAHLDPSRIWFCQIVGQRGLPEFPGPFFDTHFDYSVGPLFVFKAIPVPVDASTDKVYWHWIDALINRDRYSNNRSWNLPPNWVARSWRWGRVNMPQNNRIVLFYPAPLELLPDSDKLG